MLSSSCSSIVSRKFDMYKFVRFRSRSFVLCACIPRAFSAITVYSWRIVKIHKAIAFAFFFFVVLFSMALVEISLPYDWHNLVSSAWLQSPDVQVGFAQLVISLASTATVRATIAWTQWCHPLRQWYIWILVAFVIVKSQNPRSGSHW